jgi:hypothetical protein
MKLVACLTAHFVIGDASQALIVPKKAEGLFDITNIRAGIVYLTCVVFFQVLAPAGFFVDQVLVSGHLIYPPTTRTAFRAQKGGHLNLPMPKDRQGIPGGQAEGRLTGSWVVPTLTMSVLIAALMSRS